MNELESVVRTEERSPTRRDILRIFAVGAAGLALPEYLVGCGKSDEEITSSAEQIAKVKDETLQKAQEFIKSGNYGGAISVLESYQSDKKENIATKHVLLAEGYYGGVKDIMKKERETRSNKKRILDLNEKIKSALKTAENLNDAYKNRKWDFYLVCDEACLETNNNTTLLDTFRTLTYGLRKKDENSLRKVFDVEEQGANDIRYLENELKKYENDPEKFKYKITTGMLAGMKKEIRDQYRADPVDGWKIVYEGWRNRILKRIDNVKQRSVLESPIPYPYLGWKKDVLYFPTDNNITLVTFDNKGITTHKARSPYNESIPIKTTDGWKVAWKRK